jgi:hypothetical protein
MMLFQIEEPDGSPSDEAEGPGAAVGIDPARCAVAFAVAGNAEILRPRDEGEPALPEAIGDRLLALRVRAERALARPVTHAVIIAEAGQPEPLLEAAEAAGLTILRLLDRATATTLAAGSADGDAAVLGAARQAEDDAAALGRA